MCVQCIGGCSVHRGVSSYREDRGDTMSTSKGYHEYIGGYHEYISGCSVHRRDTMSTSGGYHEYIGGISWVHRRDIMICVGGYHEYIGDVQYIGGIPWVHQRDIMSTSWDIMSTLGDVQYIGVFNRNWKDFIKLLPHMHHDIPPMYSWYPPDVLMVSLRCTEHLPMYSWYPPHSSWYPLMYWTSPDVIMISPDVLNIPRCTEHTLYRVIIFSFPPFFNIPFFFSAWGLSIIYLEQLLRPSGGCSLVPIRLIYCLQSEYSNGLQRATSTWCENMFSTRKTFHKAWWTKVLQPYNYQNWDILVNERETKEVIGSVIKDNNTFCSIPTGFGKSLITDLWSKSRNIFKYRMLGNLHQIVKPVNLFLKT